jgi:homoserine O-acetyltransferase
MQTTLLQPETKKLELDDKVTLEGGFTLPSVTIQYTTIGEISPEKDNVIWIFHALTGNSNPLDWWSGVFGKDATFNPEKDFIICANVLGSCYGTTGPSNFDFPVITVRDMVKVHQKLRDSLGIERVKVGIGGSLGGQQLLEWAVQEPDFFEKIVPIATNAVHSPWGIAFNEAQRMALKNPDPDAGLEAARAIAMLSYRHYNAFELKQKDHDQRWDEFSASGYMKHQGKKLRKRFTPYAYYYLSKAMDSHNLGRHHISVRDALESINSEALVIGLDSDVLFPLTEQEFIHQHISASRLEVISTHFGHDGFLIEYEQLNKLLKDFIHE